MYHSNFETHATIKLHQQTLLAEAEQDRLLAGMPGTTPGPVQRFLVATGRLLVAVGTRLETRYAVASASVARPKPESRQPLSA